MANRYWVGGTANWDDTAGTKWSLTSGGAGGEAIPTSADDVFLDAASGAVTVTITDVVVNCRNLTCTGFTGTLARGPSGALTCAGSILFVAGMTASCGDLTLTLTSTSSQTITSAGKTHFEGLTCNGVGGTWALQDALTLGAGLSLINGTLDTGGFSLTSTTFTVQAGTKTLILGSTTYTLTSASLPWNAETDGANFTLTAGTSTLKFTNTS